VTTTPDVSTALEALRAVLPATLVALYTTAVILLQNLAIASGAAARAAEQAALAAQHQNDQAGLAKALQELSVEPTGLAPARVGFALVCIVLVAIYAYRTAQVVPHKRVLLEPLVATGAFVAWVAASPGTPAAAYLNATQLAEFTILVAFIAAIALWVVSNTWLKKPV
jgi:hypothetical protein